MVKKFIAGILGKKEEGQLPPSDVPDELPPLAEDIAVKEEPKEAKAEAVPALVSPKETPEELPPLDAAPSLNLQEAPGTLADLESTPAPISDAIKKAKLAKLKPDAAQQAPFDSKPLPKPDDDFSVRERIKTGTALHYFMKSFCKMTWTGITHFHGSFCYIKLTRSEQLCGPLDSQLTKKLWNCGACFLGKSPA